MYLKVYINNLFQYKAHVGLRFLS